MKKSIRITLLSIGCIGVILAMFGNENGYFMSSSFLFLNVG